VAQLPDRRRIPQPEIGADQIDGVRAGVTGNRVGERPESGLALERALAAENPTDFVTAKEIMASGRVALAGGDNDGATARLRSGIDLLARLDLPLDAAELTLTLARAHASGAPRLAVAEAQSALTAFDDLGATALADSAAALLRSLGAAGQRRPRTDDTLTKREREVMRLVATGMSNPEIARRLFISPKTVAHHVSGGLAKLGLRNRAEVAAYWSRTSDQPG